MRDVKLLSWNVNGIRAARKKGFVEWMRSNPGDIISIQETKAHVEQLSDDLLNISNYDGYFNSALRKGYSGVATYTNIEPKLVSSGFNVEQFDKEGRVLRCDYDDFTLINIYYPNGGMNEKRLKYKLEFYDVFLDYVNDLRDKGFNLVICGDLNTAHKEIDLARPKENMSVSGFLSIEREWVDKFLSNGYIDTFRMLNNKPDNYTWWSYRTRARDRNVGWRIDYFFVNEEFKNNVTNAYILSDVQGSDHCPIGLNLKI